MGVEIESPRLFLREMRGNDLDFMQAMLSDTEVMRFYPKLLSREESREWIERQTERYRRDGYGWWLVLSKEEGVAVGQVGVATLTHSGLDEPALGYMIHRPYWRRGYATEASRASLDHGFDALALKRIICPIRPLNHPSLGVARKLGLERGKTAIYAGFEHIVFAVTADEWRRRREGGDTERPR